METKDIKLSKIDNTDILTLQNDIETFLKFLETEKKNVKKLEEENL